VFDMASPSQEQLPFEIPQDEDVTSYEPVLDILDTVEKLRVMHDDPRAGFLPTTHREKNQAVAVLDYLDNPHYPGGVHDYLAEIYAHNKRLKHSSVAGTLAVQSVLYEFSDYGVAAHRDAQELLKLKVCIDDTTNPHVSLSEVAAEHTSAQLNPALLLRYQDIRRVAQDAFKGAHDPLLTQEYRRHLGRGKNKIVIDQYTSENPSEYMARYVADALELMTVGESRAAVTDAMQDQRRRFSFWSKVLSARLYEYDRYAEDARGLLKI
jgi:hypothetical protein